MLPATFQVPAALVLLLGGIIACFFGYRLFRIVLAIFGFILGVFVASSLFGASETTPMLVSAATGGLLGALLLFGAYYLAVALIGAGLGAVTANLVLSSGGADPHPLAVVFLAIAGAAMSMYLQRYFIIVGTAFGGAWTVVVGALALVGDFVAPATAAAEPVWVAYFLEPMQNRQWVLVAWVALGLAGTGLQLGITGGEHGRVVRRRKKKS
jgi:hypothetical protein